MNAQSFVTVFSGNLNAHTELLCDARELHQVLQVGRDFSNWIKGRIAEYGFEENQDFVAISQKREIGHGRGKIDYHLTLDTAKELAMVEKTEVGRQIRRYFIECEKKVHGSFSGSLKLSPAQKQQIQQAVMARHHRTGEHWQEIYRKLHAFCQVNSYHEIPAADFDRALGYLNSIPDAPEVFKQPQAARFDDREVARLATVVYYCNWACRLLKEVSRPLKALGYSEAVTMWTIADESASFLRASRETLERELPNITDSYFHNHIQHSLRRFDAVQTV
ncbi:MAG: antA/AntB antirepressor family protein [Eikenella sp.]|nr:antA/AntB antirepressor family protein [Eikenella sp.]